MVFTVSGPTSSSTYFTSEYFGFFVPVLAHKGRCTRAPRAARERHCGVSEIARNLAYASRALATAVFPRRERAVSAFGEPGHRSTVERSRASTAVSILETKKEATDATFRGSPPAAIHRSMPRR